MKDSGINPIAPAALVGAGAVMAGGLALASTSAISAMIDELVRHHLEYKSEFKKILLEEVQNIEDKMKRMDDMVLFTPDFIVQIMLKKAQFQALFDETINTLKNSKSSLKKAAAGLSVLAMDMDYYCDNIYHIEAEEDAKKFLEDLSKISEE